MVKETVVFLKLRRKNRILYNSKIIASRVGLKRRPLRKNCTRLLYNDTE